MEPVLSLILGGGRGSRLYPLTKLRSKPAVPIAGKYRLIDIPIRTCMTIAVLPVPEDQVSGFGIVRLNDSGRVVGFVEKPKHADQFPPLRTPLDWIKQRGIEPRNRPYLASMGIYLFNRDVLLELLNAR